MRRDGFFPPGLLVHRLSQGQIRAVSVSTQFCRSRNGSRRGKARRAYACMAKGFDEAWAHFCPSKPCLPLSIDVKHYFGKAQHRCGAVPFHFIQGTGGRKMYVLEFRTANRHHTWLRCAICETKAPLERVRRGQTDMMRWRILRLPGTVQAACAKWRSVPLMRYGQKSA